MTRNNFTEAEILDLSKKELTDEKLTDEKLTDQLLSSSHDPSEIKSLNLSHNEITNQNGALSTFLKKFPNLEHLDLSFNKIRANVNKLELPKNLKILILHYTYMQKEVKFDFLQKTPQLTKLDLSFNQIADSLKSLINNRPPSLEELNLERNHLDSPNIKSLVPFLENTSLPKKSSLHILKLGGNYICNIELCQNFFESLKNSQLQELHFSALNMINNGLLEALFKNFPQTLNKLILQDCHIKGDEEIKIITKHLKKTSLKTLDMANSSGNSMIREGKFVDAKLISLTPEVAQDFIEALEESSITNIKMSVIHKILPPITLTTTEKIKFDEDQVKEKLQQIGITYDQLFEQIQKSDLNKMKRLLSDLMGGNPEIESITLKNKEIITKEGEKFKIGNTPLTLETLDQFKNDGWQANKDLNKVIEDINTKKNFPPTTTPGEPSTDRQVQISHCALQ